jgi:uncharacterized protein (DUF169 family)
MQAKNWLDGTDINVILSGHAACVYYVVPAVKDKGWHVSLPCGGDLRRAACESNNLVFSAPIEILEDLVAGLSAIQKAVSGIPLQISLAAEYYLPKSYVKIGKMLGMDWVK